MNQNNTTIPVLIVGLILSFGIGYLVGDRAREVVYPFPANYNPTAAMESQGLKVAQENTRRCFDLIAEELGRKWKMQEPAH